MPATQLPVNTPGLELHARRRRAIVAVVIGLLWRYTCHSVMLFLSLLHEPRAAPRVPDTLLTMIPFSQQIWRWNYHLWVIAHLPVALVLIRKSPARFIRFLIVGGVVSLVRGICVPLTGLGPPIGDDVNIGISHHQIFAAWLSLINPLKTLAGNAAHVYLTKDMFFSGHVSSTFLLWLYSRDLGWLGPLALGAHLFTVAIVFLAHLHYTVDVIGAWAITFSIYVLFEGWLDGTKRFRI